MDEPTEQLGATVSAAVVERLKRFLGRKLIKNAVVEEAIVEYLDAREDAAPHILHVEVDEELRLAIGRFHRDNIEAPPDAIARHALRLLLELKTSAKEFVVRLGDENTIDLMDRYCSSRRQKPGVVARQVVGEFLTLNARTRGGRTSRKTRGRA